MNRIKVKNKLIIRQKMNDFNQRIISLNIIFSKNKNLYIDYEMKIICQQNI